MNKYAIICLIFLLQGCAHSLPSDTEVAQKIVKEINQSTLISEQNDIKILSTSPLKGENVSSIQKKHILQKIRQGIIAFGKYKVVSYEDQLLRDIRKLRKSEEVNQSTVAKKHSLIISDANLTGEILRLKKDYCSLTLMITNLKTGLTVWEGNYEIKCN